MSDAPETITIPVEDYRRLVESATCDDMIVICEVCGAWLDRDDDGTAVVNDFVGCWKAATCKPDYDSTCKSYRSVDYNKNISPPRESLG